MSDKIENVFNAEMITEIKKKIVDDMAKEIIGVQPMTTNDTLSSLLKERYGEKELKAEGYEPVEKNGMSLLWIKDDENESS